MRVLYPGVHVALRRLLRRVGLAVREAPAQGCCGSIYAHNGDLATAARLAEGLARTMPDDLPVVVDSAGCGSAMKEYADRAFAARVRDASELLLAEGLVDVLQKGPGLDATLTYHDACHLAHGQGIRSAPRELLAAIPRLRMVELHRGRHLLRLGGNLQPDPAEDGAVAAGTKVRPHRGDGRGASSL